MNIDAMLDLAARVLLRACTPAQAHALLARIGRLLPQRRTASAVRYAASRLGSRGTCLSRAMAIAARAPTADVVIGVRPEGGMRLFAHAWLEVDGEPIDPSHPAGREIARLYGRRRTRALEATWRGLSE